MNHHWFSLWLEGIRQQAMGWAKVDQNLFCHSASQENQNKQKIIWYPVNSIICWGEWKVLLFNTLKLLFDSCQILDLINFQNNLTLPNYNTAGISLDSTCSRLKYSTIIHRYAKKLSIHLVLVLKTSHWYQGWGQVLFEVLESSTSTFHICKYKFKCSKYLEGIKYSFIQVQVKYKYFGNKQQHFPLPATDYTIHRISYYLELL